MRKEAEFQKERTKLRELFKDCEPSKAALVDGLVDDAAFLFAENLALRETMASTGMVKVHPQHPELQKPTEAAKQYLKNLNTYAVIVKTLNGVLSKNVLEEENDLEEFQ